MLPKLFVAVGLIIILGLGFVLGKASDSSKLRYTEAGTPVDATMANRLETKKPTVTYIDSEKAGIENRADGLKESFLNYDQRPCQQFTEGTYKIYVLNVSKNGKQALIGHGCGSQGLVRSIFIKQDKSWYKIGAPEFRFRNQNNNAVFSHDLDIPSCKITKKYTINRDIAPVCYTGSAANPKYQPTA